MSPEQVLGEKVDSRSDLFSAGVVLYQLLTGHLPFDGETLISVAYKITKTEPPSLDKLRPDLPLQLRRIVERALKKQPDKRFQTGEEFATALIGVAKELAERGGARRGRGRRIPLGVRWAVMMAALVATTMTITATFLYQQQYAAMMDQVKGYGGSLAKFMATQNAVPLLSEDWAAIDVFIQETLGRQDFNYIIVVDDKGVVRGSNDTAQINEKYAPPNATPLSSRDPGVTVQSHRIADGRDVLDFAAPILFQGKKIGQVHLGIYQAPLTAVANLVLVLLGILTLVTSAAGAVGSYLLARRLAAPIRVLRNSLAELAKGRYDYRIAEARKDEFGELYAEFDKTAAALEERHEPPPPPAAAADRRRLAARPRAAGRHADRAGLRDAARRRPPEPEPPPPARAGGPRPRRGLRDRRRAARRRLRVARRALSGRRRRKAGGSPSSTASTGCSAGQDVVIPLRPRNPIGVYANGFQTVPILCYHRFGPNRSAMTVTAAGVRGADGVSRAERLPRDPDGAARALPRGQGAAAEEDRRRSPSTTATAPPTRSRTRSSRNTAFPATVYLYSDFVGAGRRA